jgi:hypothetical protein
MEVQKWRIGLPRRFDTPKTLIRTWNSAREVPEAVNIWERPNYSAPFPFLSGHNEEDSGSRAGIQGS